MVRMFRSVLVLQFGLAVAASGLNGSIVCGDESEKNSFDVVIYGGSSAGIAAAVQVSRMGKSVAIIEPSNRLGGLTTGGLGQTDIGNKGAVGGISREFYQEVKRYYESSAAWKWEEKESYKSIGQSKSSSGEDAMWTFEPHVALTIYKNWIERSRIPVFLGERLDREAGVAMTRSIPWRVISIRTESGKRFSGKVFIDATYEGDLLAAAKVDFSVGREANSKYEETLNGVQVGYAVHHQFVDGVDPYVIPGNSESGLLPFVEKDPALEDGTGDHRLQAYCFRMCMTDHPENRIPFHKPDGYEASWYELLLRNFEAGEKREPLSIGLMPNRKTDANNNFGYSTDFIGQNYDYPEASYERREEIVRQHLLYQQGLMWTLANDPRVPTHIRESVSKWGMCKDEFEEGNGWQQQLYIREARRMVGKFVMTQHHCQGREIAQVPVGLAAYTMDSHHVQRWVNKKGFVQNEGDVQVGGFAPFPIDYGAIVPKDDQCGNLLVPVCLSASHMSFGSIRMEPVFMVLGQSAATAAVHSIEENVPVQRIDAGKLTERLLEDKQVLAWTGPKPTPPVVGIPASKLPGIVIDDQNGKRTGFDSAGTTIGPFVGNSYRHDGNTDKGSQSVVFPVAASAGKYEVRIAYSPFGNRATNVPVTVKHAGGETKLTINQQNVPSIDRLFEPLGKFSFDGSAEYSVEISNEGTDGYVIVDAVQLVEQP